MSNIKTETITADEINKAVEAGAKSLTAVAKHLGYKSGSSGVLKKIIAIVPDIQSRLPVANPPAKDAPAVEVKPPAVKPKAVKPTAVKPAVTPTVKKSASKTAYPIPDCVPYRASSSYAKAWAILYAHRGTGIAKSDLIQKYRALTSKPLKNCDFDVHVVTSPKEDGSAHRSASRASGTYYCMRENDWIRLVLVSEEKKPSKG